MSDQEIMSNLSADEDEFSDAYDFDNDDEQDAHMQDGKLLRVCLGNSHARG